MNRKQGNPGTWRRMLRGGVVISLVGLGAALLTDLASTSVDPAAQANRGWGAEATVAVADGLVQLSPISLANACGMGASSCFRCHNGKRAAAPNMDAAKAPWHKHHAKVNNSCVGCHKGNARIMKEDLAHAKMLAKPHDNSAGACASCHSSDLAKVQGAYHAIAGAK
jgi:hypothetical protein